jgi:hypothetical protein
MGKIMETVGKEAVRVMKGSAIVFGRANEAKGVLENFYGLLEQDMTVYIESENVKVNIIDKISEEKL